MWIRGILILTCTLVSFFHGSNDGQKGMGLIMLILIGVVPTAYALNRALPESQIAQFATNSNAASRGDQREGCRPKRGRAIRGPAVTAYVAQHQLADGTFPSLAALVNTISQASDPVRLDCEDAAGSGRQHPQRHVPGIGSDPVPGQRRRAQLNAGDVKALNAYKGSLDSATKFIPYWVKIVVAIALGLGTMVGWKRIVVTVGSKIGKTHLTYAQGACAEITAAATIAAADGYGLPVSTTHVLSSGIAGTMAANGSGLQWSTVRNIALAWVLTLPAAMALSGTLYFIFSHIF